MIRGKVILMICVLGLFIPVVRVIGCPNMPGSKRASFGWHTGCDSYATEANFTCAQGTANYKLQTIVTTAGSGGTYAVEVWDLTADPDVAVLQTSFDETSACQGDYVVSLINGHSYRIYVDAFCCTNCNNVGEHAAAIMCHTCFGS